MPVADSARALLDLVESDRATRCQAIATEAANTAHALLADARHVARERARAAIADERRRLRDRLAALDAALATESRLHEQRRFRALLDDAWRRLPVALDALWRDAAGRRDWTRHVLAGAREELAAGDWSISCAPGWPEEERRAAIEELAAAGYGIDTAMEDARMRAGLQVRRGGNVLDGTLHGLLADRNAVGARLLDAFSRGTR
jgi:hypothetical protein